MNNIAQNLITVNSKNEQTVDARELWKFLQSKEQFVDWFNRMLTYGFEENVDYWRTKSISQKPEKAQPCGLPKYPIRKPQTNYTPTMDMAKELCMLQRNEMGRRARKYFIEVEKSYKDGLISREACKIARRSLSDVIRDSLPDSPHKKFMYKNFTDLVYKLAFGKNTKELREELGLNKEANLREHLTAEQLKLIEYLESVVRGYVGMGYDYATIKNIMMMKLE